MDVDRGATSILRQPRRADDEACVVAPKRRGVPRIRAVAIAGDINPAIVVANVFHGVFQRVERISFPVLPWLRTECRVRSIEGGAIERLHVQSRVLMPQEVAWTVFRFKGNA